MALGTRLVCLTEICDIVQNVPIWAGATFKFLGKMRKLSKAIWVKFGI